MRIRTGLFIVVLASAILGSVPIATGGLAESSQWSCVVDIRNRVTVIWTDGAGSTTGVDFTRERMKYVSVPLVLQDPSWQLGPGGFRTKGFSLSMAFTATQSSMGTMSGSLAEGGNFISVSLSEEDIANWVLTNGPRSSSGGYLRIVGKGSKVKGKIPVLFTIIDPTPGDGDPDILIVESRVKVRGRRYL